MSVIFWLYLFPLYLQLTLWLELTGVVGQEELRVNQPDKSVSVAAGQTATLRCLLNTVLLPVGTVKWFRETARGREKIYSFQGDLYPRVTVASNATKRDNMDFSIHIHNITLADTGTYYCVNFRTWMAKSKFRSGAGTQVTVTGSTSSHMHFLLGFLLGSKVLLVIGVSAIYIYMKLETDCKLWRDLGVVDKTRSPK